jgi:hypothetical protein
MRLENERHLQSQRGDVLREHQSLLEIERETASKRIREQADRYERELAAQRQRLQADIERERLKSEQSTRADSVKLEEALASFRKAEDDRFKQLKQQHEEALDDARRRNDSTTTHIKERERLEREQWQSVVLTKLNKQLEDKEKELRAKLTEERNQELDLVIRKLGNSPSSPFLTLHNFI